MPVPHLRPSYQSPGLRSSEHAKRKKGILEGLQRSSAFKSGTLDETVSFFIGGKKWSRRIEHRQGERSVSRRKESGIDETGHRSGPTENGTGVEAAPRATGSS